MSSASPKVHHFPSLSLELSPYSTVWARQKITSGPVEDVPDSVLRAHAQLFQLGRERIDLMIGNDIQKEWAN